MVLKINKSQFVEELAARCNLPVSLAERFLNNIIRLIYEHLDQGHRVNWSGFGEFSVSHRAARLGVNPRKPSQRITIPELNTPKFKAGDAFKEAIKLKK
jgi:nucleoid DNA-binding protein